MISRFIAILCLLLATPVMAADAEGAWDLRAGGTTIFRLALHRTGAAWSAVWERPTRYDIDGDSFKHVAGPVVHRASTSAEEHDGWIDLRFDYDPPGAIPDVFRLRVVGKDSAEVHYNGLRLGTIDFVRDRGIRSLDRWDTRRTYTYARPSNYPTNGEMTALFDADQMARSGTIDWKVVGEQDRQRRVRTQALLDAGALQSGDDFYHAAFLFQHGRTPDDYLKAHILATVSVARGNTAAIWIAAATLDRYLQSIGQPQVLGTQFKVVDGKATQEPNARAAIPDALRDALQVPPLSEQEMQRKFHEQADATAKK